MGSLTQGKHRGPGRNSECSEVPGRPRWSCQHGGASGSQLRSEKNRTGVWLFSRADIAAVDASQVPKGIRKREEGLCYHHRTSQPQGHIQLPAATPGNAQLHWLGKAHWSQGWKLRVNENWALCQLYPDLPSEIREPEGFSSKHWAQNVLYIWLKRTKIFLTGSRVHEQHLVSKKVIAFFM